MSILDKDSAMEDHWTDNPRFKRTNMTPIPNSAQIEMFPDLATTLTEAEEQELHDENVRLGLYDDAYGIPFVDRDEFHRLLKDET